MIAGPRAETATNTWDVTAFFPDAPAGMTEELHGQLIWGLGRVGSVGILTSSFDLDVEGKAFRLKLRLSDRSIFSLTVKGRIVYPDGEHDEICFRKGTRDELGWLWVSGPHRLQP